MPLGIYIFYIRSIAPGKRARKVYVGHGSEDPGKFKSVELNNGISWSRTKSKIEMNNGSLIPPQLIKSHFDNKNVTPTREKL